MLLDLLSVLRLFFLSSLLFYTLVNVRKMGFICHFLGKYIEGC